MFLKRIFFVLLGLGLILFFVLPVIFAVKGLKPFQVVGHSMSPYFPEGTFFLADHLGLYEQPERGEVVVFEDATSNTSNIKRVVGLPRETLEIKDGKVFINGTLLDEPYLEEGTITDTVDGKSLLIKIPENHYFLLGDNRAQSKDSRQLGTITYQDIEGVHLLTYWPPNQWDR